jgi:DNA-binding PadR family transcriptional regulator
MSVRHALLAILSEGPAYGLQLHQEFEARTGSMWALNIGQVYTTLQRLERDGLIEADGGDDDGPQRPYRITQSGSGELAEWIGDAPALASPPRDELIMKVMVALHMPGADVRRLTRTNRTRLVELMQRWTRLKSSTGEGEEAFILMVDAELLRLEGMVRWLDLVDGRLAQRPKKPKTPARVAPKATKREVPS